MAAPRSEEGPRVTPFLTKTYQLVDDHGTNDVISWNSDGTSFVVWRPAEFARDILPLSFKHNNLSSFVRQLNTYGFRKISDKWEFTNDNFLRGERKLLSKIRRRRKFSPNPPTAPADYDGSPTNSSDELAASLSESPPPVPAGSSGTGAASSSSTHLEEENNKLHQENRRLSQELSRMKKICSNIFKLVSDLNCNGVKDGASPSASPLQLLDLMPVDALSVHDDDYGGSSTRLFGVSIGTKRSRDGMLEDDMDLDGNTRERIMRRNGVSPVASRVMQPDEGAEQSTFG